MKYHIHITKQAELDMDNAASYIKSMLLNPDAALNLLLQAKKEINALSDFPQRNPLVDDEFLSGWGIRFSAIKNYLVFYIISEEEKTVHFIRFLYGRRSWSRILRQGFSLD